MSPAATVTATPARSRRLFQACTRPVSLLRASVEAALDHDMLTVAQATAYAAMLALFPALIVCAALLPLVPEAAPLRLQMGLFFARFLPSTVVPMLGAYFTVGNKDPQTATAILSAALVSLFGAVGIVSTLMEGFRRAHDLPLPTGSFWPRRLRAMALVPLSLLPLALVSGLVVFGQAISRVFAGETASSLHVAVMAVSLVVRWTLAVAGSTGIIAVLYHLGTDVKTEVRSEIEPLLLHPWSVLRRDWSWRASLPGAALATGLWLLSTLLFGIYVTRFANYARVYGSLGAGIALMVWLYLIALSILIGAEFNAQRAVHKRALCVSAAVDPEEERTAVPGAATIR